MIALLRDTLAELVGRKIFVLFIVLTVIMLFIVWGTWEVRQDLSRQSGDLLAGEELSGQLAPWVASVFSVVMSIFIFFAVFASAGLIPRALEKGRAEFLLSKPLSRTQLLIGKLASIWLVYGLMVTGCGLVVYAVTAAVHGGYDSRVALLFLGSMLEFLVWLGILGLAGVLFGSTSWALIAAFAIWIAQNLLSFHDQFREVVRSPAIVYTVESLYYLVPKTSQMRDIAVDLVSDRPVESWVPLWSSLLFAAVTYYLALWVFKRQDY